SEDMWHSYNLIQPGDTLKASTLRYVVSESHTGSTSKDSLRMMLAIAVESVEFDVQVCMLRVNGRNVEENKHVKMGAYHTIEVELHRKFTLTKPEWDIVALERIRTACDVTKKAEIAAIVLQEGLAIVALVTENMTIVRQRIECPVPKKSRGASSARDKGINRFYTQVMDALVNHIDFSIVKVLIIASPGFVKDDFYKFLITQATSAGKTSILENKDRIILAHSSSGHKHALQEILAEPAIQSRLADTKYALEVKSLDRFYQTLNMTPSRAFYGFKHVAAAVELGAVETLLVTDQLFRDTTPANRRRFVRLFEKVRAYGGNTLVFSSLHTSGEQLGQLTGIAAILSFPLPDLEDMDMEDFEAE
ncbi:MAG: hypothetical protein SGCHY_003961, partial [Lobulomycetales sp.]